MNNSAILRRQEIRALLPNLQPERGTHIDLRDPSGITPRSDEHGRSEQAAARWQVHRVVRHGLRHTFASIFVEQGGSILALKEMLGHSSLAARHHQHPEEVRREAMVRLGGVIFSSWSPGPRCAGAGPGDRETSAPLAQPTAILAGPGAARWLPYGAVVQGGRSGGAAPFKLSSHSTVVCLLQSCEGAMGMTLCTPAALVRASVRSVRSLSSLKP